MKKEKEKEEVTAETGIIPELRKYPPWVDVVGWIATRVDVEGMGLIFSHEELRSRLEIREPNTIDEYKTAELQYLNGIDKVKKALRIDHSIHLETSPKEGYVVVMPDDQTGICSMRRRKRIKREIKEIMEMNTYVREGLLSDEGKKDRLRNIERMSFLRFGIEGVRFRQINLEKFDRKRIAGGNGEGVTNRCEMLRRAYRESTGKELEVEKKPKEETEE